MEIKKYSIVRSTKTNKIYEVLEVQSINALCVLIDAPDSTPAHLPLTELEIIIDGDIDDFGDLADDAFDP